MGQALDKYRSVTPYLVFVVSVYLSGALLYGIDTGSFGSLQALPSFLRKFGTYNPATDKWVLPSNIKSAMNSIPFAGQAVGAFASSFAIDWYGYKWTMVILAIIQIVGVILELTCEMTASWVQFTVGRFLAYVSTGLAEMAVVHYNGEVAPASVRGLFAGSMLLFNALGNLWGAGMSRAYVTEIQSKGWLIPQAVQMIPAMIILMFIWFTPESPRWLVLKGRRDDALRSLNRLRPQRDIDNGFTKLEIQAMETSLEEAGGLDQGRWIDLFKGNMLWRTWIAWSLFVFLQFTGIQFTNSYGATFYVTQGLGANSFTYVVIGSALQVVSCSFQIVMYDHWGRRFFAIVGGFLCFVFLSVVSSLGYTGTAKPTTNESAINAIISSIILTQVFARFAVTNAFVIGGEIGGTKMRKKVLASGGVVNMVAAIVVTSVTPYLMDATPGSAGLGARVGWFFAVPSFLLFLFGIFVVPELKGRSLEETDELFEAGLRWGWQFEKYQTRGTGAKIAALQNEQGDRLRRLSASSIVEEEKGYTGTHRAGGPHGKPRAVVTSSSVV